MKKIYPKNYILIAFLVIIGSMPLQAQFVYPNEACSGAIPLPVGNNSRLIDSIFQRNMYADSARSTIPDCAGSTNNTRYDLWYTFTATDTAIAAVLENLSTSGMRYQLFSGTCGNLTSLQCNPTSLSFPHLSGLVPGQQYYLRTYYPAIFGVIGVSENDVPSDYKLSFLSKPVNDDCTSAALLPINPNHAVSYATDRFSNALATAPVNASCANNSGWANHKDVWYKFVATSTVHSVYAETLSPQTRLVVYGGGPGGFVSLGTHTSGSYANLTLSNLTIGSTYYIRVGAVAVVNFRLGIFGGVPEHDECAGADTVVMSSSLSCENAFPVKRLGATNSAVMCNGTSSKDVWYVFKAITPDITVSSFGEKASSLMLGLMDGNCSSFTCLVYNSDDNFSYSGLTVGKYYYLKVANGDTDAQPFICISPKMTNDECSGAIPLDVKPYNILHTTLGSDYGATQSAQPLTPCSGSNPSDVWYRFTAIDTACLITVDGSAGYPSFQVLAGDCNTFSSIYCSALGAFPPGTSERTDKVGGLVIGSVYYVRVNTNNPGFFTIDINDLPANDECTGAVQLIPQQGLAYEEMQNNGILHAGTSLPPCEAATVTKDIWYKFTATQNSMTVMNSQRTSSSKVLGYEIYSGGCAGLTSIACVQQTSVQLKAQILNGLAPGQTYYIRQYGEVPDNKFTIIERPVNDEIAGAIKLILSPANVQTFPSYYLHGASAQFGKICGNASYSVHHDVWFYFIATAATHTVSTSALNTYNDDEIGSYTYRIEAFDGYAADSASLAAKAIGCAANTLALNSLAAGDTVYIRISNTAEAGNTSSFGIKVTNNQNIDEPAGALVLDKLNSYQYSLTTAGATQSLPASGCLIQDFPDDDIWFSFTASAATKRIIAGFEDRDISLQLFSGTPGNLTALQCSNNIMLLPANLANGTQYYLRAYSKANAKVASFRIGLFDEENQLANNLNITCLGPNLVQNPDCESEYEYVLPQNTAIGYYIAGRPIAEGWWSSTRATADTWNADYPAGEWGNMPGNLLDSKDKIPRGGKGMLGLLQSDAQSDWAEYVTGKLAQPMVAGKTYLVSFYVSMEKGYDKKAMNIGAYLSNDSIISYESTGLQLRPHVTHPAGQTITEENSWVNVSGTFYADKAYSFITIGNFGQYTIYGGAARQTYFFVDDVVVAETNCMVLPLSLLDFRGKTNAQNQTELSWETATEINTSHFEIEWYAEGNTFSKIGMVAAKGNGYNAYNFLHATPADGYNYYRLKMIDNDGQFTYSKTVRTGSQSDSGINNLSVYPNPASSAINIQAQTDEAELVSFRLINVEGKVLATKQVLLRKGSNTFTWDLEHLAAGNYFISSTNRKLGTIQVIKR